MAIQLDFINALNCTCYISNLGSDLELKDLVQQLIILHGVYH